MIANDNKSDLGSLNKLVDEYNNTCYHSIDKKPVDAAYSALLEEIETNPKAPKFTNHIISACVNIGRGVNIGCDRCFYIMLLITSCIAFNN